MDLELMFSTIISLRTANWEKQMKLFMDLLVLVIVYLVFIVIIVIYIFLQYSLHISLLPHSARIIPLTTLQLHHHASLIKLTSLKLHHHMSLIKLRLLQLHHHTSLIKLTSITSLYFNYSTCCKLSTSLNSITARITLRHSRIPSSSLVTIHFPIQSGFQLSYPTRTFVSQFHLFVLTAVSNNTWDLRNYHFSPATLKLIQGHDQLIRIQYSALYAHQKSTEGSNKKRHLHARFPTAMLDAIKPAMAFLSTKPTTQNLVVAISCGNVLNMALVSPRLSFHLLQSMRFLTVLLLQVNCALFVKILFDLATLT